MRRAGPRRTVCLYACCKRTAAGAACFWSKVEKVCEMPNRGTQ